MLDLDQIAADILRGEIKLPVDGEWLVFHLSPTGVVPDASRWVTEVHADGSVTRTGEYVTAETYAGATADGNTTAALTVDVARHAVLGVIVQREGGDQRRVDISTISSTDNTVVIGTTYHTWTPTSDAELPFGPNSHNGMRYLAVGAFGDWGYRNQYPTLWTTYIANAINAGAEMWRTQTSISIFVAEFRSSPNHGGECWQANNGDYMLLRFANWLSSTGQHDDFPVKQLWTGDSLDGCIGEGYTQQLFWSKWASSVLEGANVWPFDGFNPTLAFDGGIVASSEIAHNHFNGGHPCTVGGPSNRPNIMSSCAEPDDRSFWFESTYDTGIETYGYPQL